LFCSAETFCFQLREVKDLLKKVERLRDEVHVLSMTAARKSNLLNECAAVRDETAKVKAEVTKHKKVTINICKKLLLKSIRITDKATMNQNNQFSDALEKEDGLETFGREQTTSQGDLANGVDLSWSNNVHIDTSFDPTSVWQCSNSNRIQSKLKQAKQVDSKYLSQSFSMSAL
jgi:GTPase involved in cell partitioning and DNA repair